MEYTLILEHADFIKSALFNDYKFSIISAGRRTGKTHGVVKWLIEVMLSNPGTSALWVDTRQVNIDKYVQRYFCPILGRLWGLSVWNATKKILTLPTGQYIDFASAEKPENIEGFQYNFGILNEAGIILKKASLWENTLMPMFKGDNTRVKVIGTPKGKNKFHQLFQLGKGNDIQYKSFHFSVFDSPFWEKEELNKIQLNVPQEVWRQEYLAEFIDDGGAVFRNISKCIKGGLLDAPENGRVYVAGIDVAKHVDFTVITIMDVSSHQVVAFDRFNTIDWNLQKQRIYNLCSKFGARINLDSTGVGDSIFDDLGSSGLSVTPFRFTSQSKNELVQNLAVGMDNESIGFPNIPELIGELEVFGYEVSAMGNLRYSAPEGFHDDCVISLALAYKATLGNSELPIMDIFGI